MTLTRDDLRDMGLVLLLFADDAGGYWRNLRERLREEGHRQGTRRGSAVGEQDSRPTPRTDGQQAQVEVGEWGI